MTGHRLWQLLVLLVLITATVSSSERNCLCGVYVIDTLNGSSYDSHAYYPENDVECDNPKAYDVCAIICVNEAYPVMSEQSTLYKRRFMIIHQVCGGDWKQINATEKGVTSETTESVHTGSENSDLEKEQRISGSYPRKLMSFLENFLSTFSKQKYVPPPSPHPEQMALPIGLSKAWKMLAKLYTRNVREIGLGFCYVSNIFMKSIGSKTSIMKRSTETNPLDGVNLLSLLQHKDAIPLALNMLGFAKKDDPVLKLVSSAIQWYNKNVNTGQDNSANGGMANVNTAMFPSQHTKSSDVDKVSSMKTDHEVSAKTILKNLILETVKTFFISVFDVVPTPRSIPEEIEIGDIIERMSYSGLDDGQRISIDNVLQHLFSKFSDAIKRSHARSLRSCTKEYLVLIIWDWVDVRINHIFGF